MTKQVVMTDEEFEAYQDYQLRRRKRLAIDAIVEKFPREVSGKNTVKNWFETLPVDLVEYINNNYNPVPTAPVRGGAIPFQAALNALPVDPEDD